MRARFSTGYVSETSSRAANSTRRELLQNLQQFKTESGRSVTREIEFHRLEVILAVGFLGQWWDFAPGLAQWKDSGTSRNGDRVSASTVLQCN
jgi:hypothetical protein